jgi:hypothetical protein
LRSRVRAIVLWKLWAAIGAVVCGVAVTTLPGGTVSPWAYRVLTTALLVGVGVTVVDLAVLYGRNRRLQRASRITQEPTPKPSARQFKHDRTIVKGLQELLSERGLGWLRDETFSGTWRDDRVTPLREIARFDAGRTAIFDHRLADAVDTLTEAARAFVDLYEEGTIADPVVAGSIWRIIESGDRTGTEARLRAAAASVVEAHDTLAVVANDIFEPRPPARRPGNP